MDDRLISIITICLEARTSLNDSELQSTLKNFRLFIQDLFIGCRSNNYWKIKAFYFTKGTHYPID